MKCCEFIPELTFKVEAIGDFRRRFSGRFEFVGPGWYVNPDGSVFLVEGEAAPWTVHCWSSDPRYAFMRLARLQTIIGG